MAAGYDVVLVRKGATVWVCDRCGSVTVRPTEHDAWHALIVLLLDVAEQISADR